VLPFFRFFHHHADKEGQHGRRQSDEQQRPPAPGAGDQSDERTDEKAHISGSAEHAGQQRPFGIRPGLHDQRHAQTPFAAQAHGAEKTAGAELPYVGSDGGECGEQAVGDHGEDHGFNAADLVAQAAENESAHRSAEKKQGEHDTDVWSDDRAVLCVQQLFQRRHSDEGVQSHLHAVEQPPQPGD